MSGVPYTFGTATTSIPLSNLDSNFVTPITIGNASVALGNTITSIGNLTLTNPTIIGGTSNVTSTSISNGTSNVAVLSSNSNVTSYVNGVLQSTLSSSGLSLTGSLNSINTFGFKNRLINGAMVIDQRNAGASSTAGGYTVDRWKFNNSAASKGTWGQNLNSVTPPLGFTNYLGFQSSSSYSVSASDYFTFNQVIEGFNCQDLAWGTANAKTVTLSFQVYSSLTGTFGGSLYGYQTGTPSYPFSYSIPVANTWTTVSITIAGPTSGSFFTNNSGCFVVVLSMGAGSTYSGTAGSWVNSNLFSATGATSVVGTNGATFYITGVQLEVGTNATSFDYRPYTTEQLLCYRYCYRWTAGVAFSYVSLIRQYSTTNGTALVKLPVAMRGTISGSTIAINSANWDYSVTAINPVSNQSADNNYVQCDVTGTFTGASYCGALGSSGTAQANWIQWTSEL